MLTRLVTLVAAILLLAAPGWQAEVSAEEASVDYTQFSLDDLMEMSVVSGASKYMQKTSEAPSSISLVTAEEIRTYGWRSLWEVLSSLRGFYDTYDINYYYMGVRGIGYPGDLSSRLLVLVDGVRVNETNWGGTLFGRGFPVDLDLISRIEVIRGPASSLYGTNAMVGVVNIVTREGYQLRGTEVKSGFSSFGTLEGRFTYGMETESGVDLLVSGSKGRMEGQDYYYKEFDAPETNDGWARGVDSEKWENLFAKLIYENLTLESYYTWRAKQNPTGGVGMMFNDRRALTTDIHTALAATYKRVLPHDINMTFRTYYQNFNSEIRYPYDWDFEGNTVPEGVIYEQDSYGKRLTTELDLTKAVRGGHMIAAGAEYRKTFAQDTYVYDQDPYFNYYELELEPTNYSAYLLTDLRVMKGLRASLGLRHDSYKNFASSTNPRLALVTEPIAGSVFKVAYGKAFRAPVGYELPEDEAEESYVDLSPNEIETIEVIYEQSIGDNWNTTVSAYDWEYKDLPANTDPDDISDYYLDHESIDSKGVEFEVAGKLDGGIHGRTSWSYNEVDVPDSELTPGKGEPRGPMHMAKANVSVPLRGKETRLGLELRHVSKRLTVRREWTEPYTLVNLSVVDTKLLGGPELRAGVYNLFDSENGHPGTWGEDQQVLWQDGRSYRLYLTISQ